MRTFKLGTLWLKSEFKLKRLPHLHLDLLLLLKPYKNGWFIYANDPVLPILAYHFSLIKSFSQNLLTLEEFNVCDLGDNAIAYRIDFKPATNRYFVVPKEEFGNLSSQQLNEHVLNNLMDFIHSPGFQGSFLSKGGSIRMGLAGEIWSG